MSGMHLLPIYYTTTNHKSKRKKPRKKSKKMEAALREHEKFLKKMGVSSSPTVREPAPLKLDRPQKQLPEKSLHEMDWSPCPKKTRHKVTVDAVVGQAYNKGNYQVLSTKEVKDTDTGKRRV